MTVKFYCSILALKTVFNWKSFNYVVVFYLFQFFFSSYFLNRAATIVSNGEGIIWALDRVTFRKIVLKAAYLRVCFIIFFIIRRMYFYTLVNGTLAKLKYS